MQTVRVEAPDALTGFLLARRFAKGTAELVAKGDGWEVRISTDSRLDLVMDVVQRWLDDEQILVSTISADGRTFTLNGRFLRIHRSHGPIERSSQ
jgi:hypothetical protein